MKKKKYNLGGNLQKTQGILSTAQGVAGLGDSIVPGLGSALSTAIGIFGQGFMKHAANKDIESSLTQMTVNTNPFGFALGGILKGRDDFSYYKGQSHSTGGIKTSSTGIPTKNGINEVEGGETKVQLNNQDYIFSNRLKI